MVTEKVSPGTVIGNESLIIVGSRESVGGEEQAVRIDESECGCEEEWRNGQ